MNPSERFEPRDWLALATFFAPIALGLAYSVMGG